MYPARTNSPPRPPTRRHYLGLVKPGVNLPPAQIQFEEANPIPVAKAPTSLSASNEELPTKGSLTQLLCFRCQTIQKRMDDTARRRHYMWTEVFSWSSLRQSRCDVCRVIYQGLNELIAGYIPDDSQYYVCFGRRFTVHLYHIPQDAYPPSWEISSSIKFFCNPAVPCPWGIFSSSLVPDPRTARLGSFALASSWIKKCGLSHSCVVPRDSQLPSRVLDIGTKSDRIRLFKTNGLVGRYTCLSHCWGGKQILRTTKDNVKSHLVSIPWNDIPRTFQDAIIFVWQLGVQYLWIDSLCIIQDDIDDWVRESAAMCDIYENSWLTIAATSASDAQTGLYLRDGNEFFDVCNTMSTGAEYRVLACRSYPHPEHTKRWFRNDRWPLLERGWVFQERLISPRVLHICRSEMIWECKEEMVCECGESRPMGKEEYYQSLKQPSLTKLLKQWQNLVEAYSWLKLSFESDKLPALSGLANQMARLRPDAKYLAGLWSDSLELDLLWINARVGSEYGKLDSRSSLWRAPSWSWAALNAPIIFPLSNTHYSQHDINRSEMVESYFAILDAQTCLATSDPTGQVKSARLTICGSLFDATLWIDKQFSNPEMFLLSIDSVGKKVLQRHNVPDRVLFDDPYDPLHLGSETNCSGEGISCMRMARVRHRHYFPYQEVVEFEYALAMYRKSESTDYKRVGMVVQERASELAEDLINPSGMWQNWPSYFAAGGLQRTIAIV